MLTPILLFGQNEQITKIDLAKNNIYAEAHLGLFTKVVMNYEWQIYSGEKVSWYGRLGGGYGLIMNFSSTPNGWGGLGGVTMLTGKKNNYFELNTGFFLGSNKLIGASYYDNINNEYYRSVKYEAFIFPFFDMGYRYQKPSGGFIFRANASLVGLGISFGYAF